MTVRVLLVNAKPTLADALDALGGIDVSLLWPRRHHFQQVPPPVRVAPQFYAGGAKLNVRAIWQMRSILNELRPDVVHAFYGRALAHAVVAASTMHKRPRIVSFRGITSPLSRFDVGDWLSYRHPFIDAHACESAAVRESLVASGIESRRCWVTYNSMYNPPQRRPGRAGLVEFGIPAEAFVVGTVATMRRVKGIDLLLRAALRCADLRDIYWVLIGPTLDPEVRFLAADPDIRSRILLLGHRLDASELISGADVFVMSSRAEALCQALLEAMHQRVCPVVSDAGGMKEAVRHGQDGLVVPSENADALAQAIRYLYTNQHVVARYAASAYQRVASEFTPKRMAGRCLKLYAHVLGASAGRAAA